MNHYRTAIALGLVLLAAVSAYAACPTTPPTYYLQVTYAGTNCSSSFYGGTCALAQPVEFTASYVGYGDPAQPCDVITWNYGDGTTETKPAGVMTGTHSYATAGTYPITMTVTNSLGIAPVGGVDDLELPVDTARMRAVQAAYASVPWDVI